MTVELLGTELVMDSVTLAGLAVVLGSAAVIAALGRRGPAMVPVRARRARRR